MTWQFQSDQPIYTQLIAKLTLEIVAGRFPPGSKFPSVRDLSQDAGVNPNTMQRALTELEREGLLFSQRTSGRFITEDLDMIQNAKKNLARAHIQCFVEAMKDLGYSKAEIIDLLRQTEEKGEAS